jgi:hypothetical protein
MIAAADELTGMLVVELGGVPGSAARRARRRAPGRARARRLATRLAVSRTRSWVSVRASAAEGDLERIVEAIIHSRGRAIAVSAGNIARIDRNSTSIASAAIAERAGDPPRKYLIVSTVRARRYPRARTVSRPNVRPVGLIARSSERAVCESILSNETTASRRLIPVALAWLLEPVHTLRHDRSDAVVLAHCFELNGIGETV